MVSQLRIQFTGKPDITKFPSVLPLRDCREHFEIEWTANLLPSMIINQCDGQINGRKKTSMFKWAAKTVEFVGHPGKCPGRVREGWHGRTPGAVPACRSHLGNTRKSDIQHLLNEYLVWCVPNHISHRKTSCGFYGLVIKAVIKNIQINIWLNGKLRQGP